jgi:hypothetical protein
MDRGFEGFHRGQERRDRIDGGAVERKQNVPYCQLGPFGRATRNDLGDPDVIVWRRFDGHAK